MSHPRAMSEVLNGYWGRSENHGRGTPPAQLCTPHTLQGLLTLLPGLNLAYRHGSVNVE